MKKPIKIVIIVISSFVLAIALATAIPFTILGVKTNKLNVNYESLRSDETYSKKVEVNGVNLVTQHVSCGYATIEMLSDYYGKKVSEDDLDQKNKGGVSTSSSSGFLKEINRSIDSKEYTMKSYLDNQTFLKEIHDSLSHNDPVAIEWAAKYENEWTLHFSVVTSLDLENDQVTIYNPYGYIENIDVDSFIERTTFKAYKNIPLFLNFGFAFGAFHKNTLFVVK